MTVPLFVELHVPNLDLWFINDKKEEGDTSDQKSVDVTILGTITYIIHWVI